MLNVLIVILWLAGIVVNFYNSKIAMILWTFPVGVGVGVALGELYDNCRG